jgi:hypothetical protein
MWHCKYTSLVALSGFKNLETLVVASYPDDSFELLSGLMRIKFLGILHFPEVKDLTPLANLQHLESLSLATLPSWDASGRVQVVASLEPISRLYSLRHLELFGVVPPDRKLTPLLNLRAILSARFSKYPEEQVKHFLPSGNYPRRQPCSNREARSISYLNSATGIGVVDSGRRSDRDVEKRDPELQGRGAGVAGDMNVSGWLDGDLSGGVGPA